MASRAVHRERFERWHARLPSRSAQMVARVRSVLIPSLERHGYFWFDDYAGGRAGNVGGNEIPLQKRSGDEWPTVHIRFDLQGRPFFHIFFAALPVVCRTNFAQDEVPRSEAMIIDAPGLFSLRRGNGAADDGRFGYVWASLWPARKIESEVNAAVKCLPFVFDLLSVGVPREWLERKPGRVDAHAALHSSWYCDRQRQMKTS